MAGNTPVQLQLCSFSTPWHCHRLQRDVLCHTKESSLRNTDWMTAIILNLEICFPKTRPLENLCKVKIKKCSLAKNTERSRWLSSDYKGFEQEILLMKSRPGRMFKESFEFYWKGKFVKPFENIKHEKCGRGGKFQTPVHQIIEYANLEGIHKNHRIIE